MGHSKRRTRSSSGNSDRLPAGTTVACEAIGSEAGRIPDGPSDSSGRPRAGRPRWLRLLFWVCTIALAVVVVLRVALWLSLPWILDRTMAQYGLEARYERLRLSLLTGDAELWHLVLVPSDANTPLVDVEYCRADVSLVTLLTRRLVVHRIEIDGMDVSLTRAEDGTFPQLRTLLVVLRERSDATPHADAEVIRPFAPPREIDLTPPLRMDALRLQHVQVRFRDETVSPVFETRLDLNVRLSDLRSDKRQTRFQVILSSPPVLSQLTIEGTGSAQGRDLLAEVRVALQGVQPGAVEEYLAGLGVIPDARTIGFACDGAVRVQGIQVVEANDVDLPAKQSFASGETPVRPSVPVLRVHLESKNAAMTIDGAEHFALHSAVVDANVFDSGAVRVGQVQVNRGAFHVWRRPTGMFSVGGFQFAGRSPRRPAIRTDIATTVEEYSGASQSADGSSAQWSLDGIGVRDVRFVLHDQSVSPQVDLVLDLNEVTVEHAPSPSEGLTLTARLGAPGIVESLHAGGTMVLSSSESRVALKIVGTAICPDALQPHLRSLGLESLYRAGTFTCDVNAVFVQQDDGPFNASASITNISLQDTQELLGLKAIAVHGVRIDPPSGTTYIDQVEVSGQRLALERDPTGCLTVLGFRLTGTPSASESQGGPSPLPVEAQSGSMETGSRAASAERSVARIEIGRLSWHDNELTLVDRMVTPVKTFAIPDLGLELTDLVLGAEDGAGSPASVKAWLRSPGMIDRVELSGSVAPELAGLSFDLNLHSDGVALVEMAPYLEALGAESTMTRGSLAANAKGRVGWDSQGIRCSATVLDATLKDGDAEIAGLDRIDLAQLRLADTGLEAQRIAIERPRLTISREESGAPAFAGVRIIAGRGGQTETSSESALPVRIGQLEVREARLQWFDHAVAPAVAQTMSVDLTLNDFALGVDAPPATVVVAVRAPGVVQQVAVSGQIQTSPLRQAVDLMLEAEGVDTGPLLAYLPPGVKPALEAGRFRARIAGELTHHPDGGRQGGIKVTDVDYRRAPEGEPLLRFDSAELAVDRFDPNAYRVSLRHLSLQGVEAAVERTPAGTLSVLGFEFGASEPTVIDPPVATDEQPNTVTISADERPGTESIALATRPDPASGTIRRAQRLPLVTLERLSLEAANLTVTDRTRPTVAPVVVSDLTIANTEGIRILGDEPDVNPPIRIDLHGRLQPLAESVRLKLEVSPFVAQPQILAQWDISRISGSGLASVSPELGVLVDANDLRHGRLSGNAQLTVQAQRRSSTEFDLSRPFGIELLARAIVFEDTEAKTVLAGLEEIRAVIPKVDLPNGSVHVKEVGLVKPQGAVRREADGFHLLGMTVKTSSAEAVAGGNAVAASAGRDANEVTAHRMEGSQGQSGPLDIRVDQFLVSGVDFRFVDNTVDPPMYIPLKGLDVEVRGFTTPGADTRGPMRFNVVATAGEVPLPGKGRGAADESVETSAEDATESPMMEDRLLFQEMSATGRLTLYPHPDGWVKAGMSGLELANFKGLARENGMTLRRGVFDASIDMRFHKDQPLSARARLVFTDLSLTEPPDGFLAKLLTLPVSLDTVLFILRDAGGSIRLPLSFKIDEQGVSRGQITQAAVGAAATLIAGAVAGSPYRVAGTIGNILGGEKEEPSGAETQVVQYAAAVTTLSVEQAEEVAIIAERLRRERDLSVTVRHHLSGGDIGAANSLVNLSPEDTRELLVKLRQERAELQRLRNELAGQTRLAHAAGSRGNAIVRTRRLQQAEVQLGLIERALDDLLETMRPGAEYAARRRTQDACVAIGKTRMETLAALLRIEEIPEASGRVTFVPPRFMESDDPAGGSITLTFIRSKAH